MFSVRFFITLLLCLVWLIIGAEGEIHADEGANSVDSQQQEIDLKLESVRVETRLQSINYKLCQIYSQKDQLHNLELVAGKLFASRGQGEGFNLASLCQYWMARLFIARFEYGRAAKILQQIGKDLAWINNIVPGYLYHALSAFENNEKEKASRILRRTKVAGLNPEEKKIYQRLQIGLSRKAAKIEEQSTTGLTGQERVKLLQRLLRQRNYQQVMKQGYAWLKEGCKFFTSTSKVKSGCDQKKLQIFSLMRRAMIKTRSRSRENQVIERMLPLLKEQYQAKYYTMQYRLAINLWNINRGDDALITLEKMVQNRKISPSLRVKCCYVAGRIHTSKGRFKPAEKFYNLLLKIQQQRDGDKYVPETLFSLALNAYALGDFKKSLAYNNQIISQMPGSRYLIRAVYWKAKTLKAKGDFSGARQVYQMLPRLAPFNYYTFRSLSYLDKVRVPVEIIEPRLQPPAIEEESETFWHQYSLLFLARELLKLDLKREGQYLIKRIDHHNHPFLGFQMSRLAFDNGLYLKTIRFLRPFWKQGFSVSSFYFPRLYLQLIEPVARKYGLDPFLILSVARQESAFEKDAVSWAGARGVLQLMPRVAESTLKKMSANDRRYFQHLETTNFRQLNLSARLLEPQYNIPLAVHLLNNLKERYGNVIYMLAAYNAGRGALDAWRKSKLLEGNIDLDYFIERVSYQETRSYIRNIIRNYILYYLLYNGENSARKALKQIFPQKTRRIKK